jgi:hypothetical protein
MRIPLVFQTLNYIREIEEQPRAANRLKMVEIALTVLAGIVVAVLLLWILRG